MSTKDTIVALSTPPGRSGIGIIRLSGDRALEISAGLFPHSTPLLEPKKARLTKLYDPGSGKIIDHALVTYFKSPQSFTGEDVVELSCHGSPLLLRHLIDIILRADARLAGPGEFTLRALANGRVNLSQAEAIRDLINAQTHAALLQANRQLGGELSIQLQPIKDALLEIIVPLESSLEFVEDDLPAIKVEELKSKLETLIQRCSELAGTFSAGHLLRDGIKVALVGKPNVGKSSVFNKLLERDRAIVTDVAGTTRDSLNEIISLGGIPVHLTDTAGLRGSTDPIENLGVERTRRAIADADLVVLVVDGSEASTAEDREAFLEIRNRLHLIALNKNDLPYLIQSEAELRSDKTTASISISARTGTGLDDLRAAILHPFASHEISADGLLVTDARHFDLLQRTVDSLRASQALLVERASEELILVGLYGALRYLGEITGETTPDDVLSEIFATFCIGK